MDWAVPSWFSSHSMVLLILDDIPFFHFSNDHPALTRSRLWALSSSYGSDVDIIYRFHFLFQFISFLIFNHIWISMEFLLL